MTFERFSQEFMKGLEEKGYEVETVKVTKVNEKLTAIRLKNASAVVQASPYLERLHKSFEAGVQMNQLIDDTAYMLTHVDERLGDIPNLNQENARNRLYCTVINKKMNEELIAGVPHQDIQDLSLIARFKVFENGSYIVDNNMCGRLKLTADEVMQIAKENTFGEDYQFRPMMEILTERMLEDGLPPEYVSDMLQLNEHECPMYVLTNKYSVNGATMMASKEVLDKIYMDLNENFYILPSSLHEVILIPEHYSDDVQMLRDIVCEVNNAVVEDRDRLSDNVYYYDGMNRNLSIAGQENVKTDEHTLSQTSTKGR